MLLRSKELLYRHILQGKSRLQDLQAYLFQQRGVCLRVCSEMS
jgi:hypothetical protein